MDTIQAKPTVLLVDDTPENIDVLRGVLQNHFKTKVALNAEKAIQIAQQSPRPDMILLDIMMPKIDGYQACEMLKAHPLTCNIPIIFVSAKDGDQDEAKGLELGAVDYITKPIRPAIVLSRVKTHLALSNQQRLLETSVSERTAELKESRKQIIQCLGQAAEYKDNETGLHIIRMSHYSRIIASAINKGADWAELVFQAAPMHDIGKIGIPDHILKKPGRLDEEEFKIIQKHPEYGAKILGKHKTPLLFIAREIALAHHEKWDGSGYPLGLKQEEIPLTARVVAIADVFDALTSVRPYKKPWPEQEAIDFIRDQAGKHFDPTLVELFLANIDEILEIKHRYAEQDDNEHRIGASLE